MGAVSPGGPPVCLDRGMWNSGLSQPSGTSPGEDQVKGPSGKLGFCL